MEVMQGIGFLGCGRVAQRYIEVCRDELKNANVVVVCDHDSEKADHVAQKLNTKAVYHLDDLLAQPDLDVVFILTESGKHALHTKQVLDAGKHVVVEKPPALYVDEIIENERYASQQQKMYAAIQQNRFNPAMKKLKETYESGRFGKTVLATIRLRWCRYQDYYEDGWHGTWAMDGGVINQQANHHLDALQWVCGPIESVVAAQSNALNQLEAEDTTVAIVKFENGALGAIEATTAARPDDFEASISIVGEKGTAVIGGIALNEVHTWQFINSLEEDEYVAQKYSQSVPNGYGLSHGPLLQEIIDRLNKGQITPPITATDASHCVRLVHALYRSTETNTWVHLQDSPQSSRLGKIN